MRVGHSATDRGPYVDLEGVTEVELPTGDRADAGTLQFTFERTPARVQALMALFGEPGNRWWQVTWPTGYWVRWNGFLQNPGALVGETPTVRVRLSGTPQYKPDVP